MSALEKLCPPDLYASWRKKSRRDTFFTLWSWVASFVVCWFTDKSWDLPEKLKDYRTPDSKMNGGGWDGKRGAGGGDQVFYDKWMARYNRWAINSVFEYLARVLISFCWQWRNPGQGYSYFACGVALPDGYVIWQSPEGTRDFFTDGMGSEKEGWYYAEIRDPLGNAVMFQYYSVQHYGVLNNRLGHRKNQGYKFNFRDDERWEGVLPIVNSDNPFKSIDKE